MHRSWRDSWGRAVLVAAAVVGLVLLLQPIGVVRDLTWGFEARTLDYRIAWYRGLRGAEGTAPADPVIVAIDEASLAELGQFQRWPRLYHAELVDRLTRAGARAIAFDLLFTEPDRQPPRAVDLRLRALPPADTAQARRILSGFDDDVAFAAAIARSGRVFLASFQPDTGRRLARPVAPLARAARGVGHVHVRPDADGIVRRIRLGLEAESGPEPALGAAVARAVGAEVAKGPAGDYLLDFAGPPGTFLRVPYADVLAGRVEPALFEGRIVLVGGTAAGLMDELATPYPGRMPGVEVHATLIHDLLTGRALRPAGLATTLVAALLLAALGAWAFLRLSPPLATLVALGALAVFGIVAFEQLATRSRWIEVVRPTLAWGLAGLVASGWRYGAENRGRREIKRAFGHYLAPDLVERIAREPERLALGGEERFLTVGFIDLRDFTALTERLSPAGLTTLLGEFFAAVTTAVLEHGGLVDKYIGDSVMVLFGVPHPQEDHAARACRAALAVCAAFDARAQRWAELGAPDLALGVALNTGSAVVGNVGTPGRFSYTALGDVVNTAARLEGFNARLGTRILVGEATRREAGPGFVFRGRGELPVRGKAEPVTTYELAGEAPALEAP